MFDCVNHGNGLRRSYVLGQRMFSFSNQIHGYAAYFAVLFILFLYLLFYTSPYSPAFHFPNVCTTRPHVRLLYARFLILPQYLSHWLKNVRLQTLRVYKHYACTHSFSDSHTRTHCCMEFGLYVKERIGVL